MGEILVEVEPVLSGDLAARPAVPEKFQDRAAEIANSVADVAEQFRDQLAERVATTPESRGWGLDQVELSFQVSVQVQGGVVIKATGGATFGVKLTWKLGE
jgi:hypothetical protein